MVMAIEKAAHTFASLSLAQRLDESDARQDLHV